MISGRYTAPLQAEHDDLLMLLTLKMTKQSKRYRTLVRKVN